MIVGITETFTAHRSYTFPSSSSTTDALTSRLLIAGTLINMRYRKIIHKFVCTHSKLFDEYYKS